MKTAQKFFVVSASVVFAGLLSAVFFSGHAISASSGIPVLTYHEIVADGSKKPGRAILTLTQFQEQMQFLKQNGYQTLSLDELVQVLQEKKKAPVKPVVITLDDGFINALQALPILELYGFKASFWIFPGKGLGGVYMDWKSIEALDKNPLFEVGAHSISHPDLAAWISGRVQGKGEPDVRFELQESKRILEEHLGHPVRYFAWPYGKFNEKLIQLARDAGYEALFTTEHGLNYSGQDLMRIHRAVVDGSKDFGTFKELLK